ncbi:hypothetical protein [Pseudoclavibacter sp. RFBB5]|uniref:phosphoribosyltransferase-like protein n=1 Tax=Pseudoclavibacter sp. RFBB5 TaxID=2080574 RepID=UPI0011B0BECD|nr:hypothetical protein [Pseudoclavibacter sp. RFBB5]
MALLESHVHLDGLHVRRSVISNLARLRAFLLQRDSLLDWDEYITTALVTIPEGRHGDITGSGTIFARLAKTIGLPEENTVSNSGLHRHCGDRARNLIYFDDLAGSGEQFINSWERHQDNQHGRLSAANMKDKGMLKDVFYLPVVATSNGLRNIENKCKVKVLPTYELDDTYSALSPNTRLVPSRHRPYLSNFLAKYAALTELDTHGPFGHGEVALNLSFEHGCPDNTVPIMRWGTPTATWTPLISPEGM